MPVKTNMSSSNISISIHVYPLPADTQILFNDVQLGAILRPLFLVIAITAAFGSFANVINMLVFLNMGLSSPTNVCLFSLSIADLISLSFFLLLAVGKFLDTSRWRISYQTLIAEILLHLYFIASAFGSWVTTVISAERCCSVTFPLRVRRIFNKRAVVVLLVLFIVFQMAATVPYSLTFKLIKVNLPGSNLTQVRLDPSTQDLRQAYLIRFVSNSLPTCVCFILVIIATVVLIISLNKSLRKREAMTSGQGQGQTATDSSERKEIKIAKSVAFICVIYILGYSVNVCKYFVSLHYPLFNNKDSVYGNLVSFVTVISMVLQTLSFSVNIFVYLNMSSKFKSTLLSLLPFGVAESSAAQTKNEKSP